MALTEEQKRSSKSEFFLLLAIQTYVCFFSNGALPSIQTYSCLPFGNTVYHLAVTLSAMANPVMAFAAFFIPCKKVKYIAILIGIGSIFGGFILATALYSPNMLLGQAFGGFLTVSWYLFRFCYLGNYTYHTSSIQTISNIHTLHFRWHLGLYTEPYFHTQKFLYLDFADRNQRQHCFGVAWLLKLDPPSVHY